MHHVLNIIMIGQNIVEMFKSHQSVQSFVEPLLETTTSSRMTLPV